MYCFVPAFIQVQSKCFQFKVPVPVFHSWQKVPLSCDIKAIFHSNASPRSLERFLFSLSLHNRSIFMAETVNNLHLPKNSSRSPAKKKRFLSRKGGRIGKQYFFCSGLTVMRNRVLLSRWGCCLRWEISFHRDRVPLYFNSNPETDLFVRLVPAGAGKKGRGRLCLW